MGLGVWLYDDSGRTYLCTSSPSIWAEPLYPIEAEADADAALEDGYPEPDYFAIDRDTTYPGSVAIDLDPGEVPADFPEKDAWDVAREEANGNHRI